MEANTFPSLNGLGHFLPNAKLKEVTDTLKTVESEFWQAKAQFLQQYASLREEAAQLCQDMLHRKRLVASLSQLANHAQVLAKQDASDLVQRFGQVEHRKFHLAA